MLDLVEAQCLAFTVFEPFLRRLVATNIKIPHTIGHFVKVLVFVNPNLVFLQLGLINTAIPFAFQRIRGATNGRGLHQMQPAQLTALLAQAPKFIRIGRPRDAREIIFQKLGISAAIDRAVQHGIDVIEYCQLVGLAVFFMLSQCLQFFIQLGGKVDLAIFFERIAFGV